MSDSQFIWEQTSCSNVKPTYASFTRELQRVIRVLCGTCRAAFEGEKLQRLYQLKFWLNDDAEDYESLCDGAGLYAGLRIATLLKSAGDRGLRSIERFDRLTRSEELSSLFDDWVGSEACFALHGGPRLQPGYSHKAEILYSVNHFTELCLRSRMERKTKVLYWARERYRQDCMNDHRLYCEVDPLRQRLRARLSFLYVASKHAGLIHIPTRPNDLFRHLANLADREASFKSYFACCAQAQGVLCRGSELTGTCIAGWAGVKPRRIRGLTPLSDSEVQEAESRNIRAEERGRKN